MITFGRDRSHTVRWFDPDLDLVVEVAFERKLIAGVAQGNSAAWKRITSMGFGGYFMYPSVSYTTSWRVRHLQGPEPYQATDVDPVAEPSRFAAAIQTATGLMLFEIDDQLPGPGFRIVTESESE